MTDYVFSKHAAEMMEERSIPEDWVWRVLNEADHKFIGEDGNLHFTKSIVEKEERVLHVVVNSGISFNRVITMFFDRRLRNKK